MSRQLQLCSTCQRCRAEETAAIAAGRWVPPRRPAVTTTPDGEQVCQPHADSTA